MKLFRALALIAVLGVVGGWVYSRYLAPAPDVLLRVQATGSAQDHIQNGELEAALADIDTALEERPDDWELLVWQSVLADRLTGAGEESLARALALGTQPDVWIVQGMVALLVSEPDTAVTAGLQASEHSPDAPQGYFLAAQGYEQLGDIGEAIRLYTQAADLAADEPGILVAAKERIAALR